jgi:hypothetical protein
MDGFCVFDFGKKKTEPNLVDWGGGGDRTNSLMRKKSLNNKKGINSCIVLLPKNNPCYNESLA